MLKKSCIARNFYTSIGLNRDVHSGNWVDFELGVSGQFKIVSYVYIHFCIILNFILKSVRFQSRVNIGLSTLF